MTTALTARRARAYALPMGNAGRKTPDPAVLLRLPNDTAELLDRLIASMGAIVGRNRAAIIHALAISHPSGAAALGCLARSVTTGNAGDLQGLSDQALERVRAAHAVESAEVARAHEASVSAVRAEREHAVAAAQDRGRLTGFREARLGLSHEAASVLVRAWPEHAAAVLARAGIRIVTEEESDEVAFEKLYGNSGG